MTNSLPLFKNGDMNLLNRLIRACTLGYIILNMCGKKDIVEGSPERGTREVNHEVTLDHYSYTCRHIVNFVDCNP